MPGAVEKSLYDNELQFHGKQKVSLKTAAQQGM